MGWIYLSLIRKQTMDTRLNASAVQAGLAISASYFLILCAMSFVPTTGDIVAFRQISIPVGFILGIVVMGENVNTKKIISMVLICSGLVMISG